MYQGEGRGLVWWESVVVVEGSVAWCVRLGTKVTARSKGEIKHKYL
jgi:hypothetical protein